MTKLGSVMEIYRSGGILAVFDGIRDYILRDPWGPTVQRVLGHRLHQKLLMYPRVGYWPQIRDPRTFNEKLMHRKLYTNDDRFSTVEDKWAVRDYVVERVGEEILPRVYHVTDNPETIPFETLPDEYVVKPTHLSGPVAMIEKGEIPDREELVTRCQDWLTRRHGTVKGEYWYDNITPRILIEERLYGIEADVPRDFKFFVFHGRVEYIQVDFDRYTDHSRRLYTRDWEPLDVTLKFPLGPETSAPDHLEEMISIAETLGAEFDFIRVDLYETAGIGIKFGELTVAPGSGGEQFTPRAYDMEFGKLW